ncbi:hypothetical protein [Streptomyces benahoarensis]|uniref:Uncharacterized protein n=1 Tax=Streptomyces benahoarensis TaxID=2595054 RepID=A0A553ZCK4_9ACTN|nr:hypothetical protein [Streptomyces benahoarensis]TSB25290.1 hypothetical protein FNJ62_13180 [Streptomyces benahoarensis]TSB39170.1 hypothetical protein FNZ23_15865 [Streptomyces benahoarensis]
MTATGELEAVGAGTVGDDVLTVHKLVRDGANLRSQCDAGKPKGQVDQWLRAVNCPACLADGE